MSQTFRASVGSGIDWEQKEKMDMAQRMADLALSAAEQKAKDETQKQDLLQQWLNPPQNFAGQSDVPVNVGNFAVQSPETGNMGPMQQVGIGPMGVIPFNKVTTPGPILAADQAQKKEIAMRHIMGIPIGAELPEERATREIAKEDVIRKRQMEVQGELFKRSAMIQEETQKRQVAMANLNSTLKEALVQKGPLKIGSTKEALLSQISQFGIESLSEPQMQALGMVDKTFEESLGALSRSPEFQMKTPPEQARDVDEMYSLLKAVRYNEASSTKGSETAGLPPPASVKGGYELKNGKVFRSDGTKWISVTDPKVILQVKQKIGTKGTSGGF